MKTLLLILSLLYTCTTLAASKEAVYPSGTIFYKTDDLQDVPITIGSTLIIELEEDINDKYFWGIVKQNTNLLELLSNTINKKGKDRAGIKIRIITLKALKPGKINLKLIYYPAGREETSNHDYISIYQLNIKIIQQ